MLDYLSMVLNKEIMGIYSWWMPIGWRGHPTVGIVGVSRQADAARAFYCRRI